MPDPVWLQDCPVPELHGQRNAQLVDFYFSALDALEKCNLDKSAIRSYVEQSGQ